MGEPTIHALDPALMASAVQSLAEGIVLVDADGRILYVNRAFAEGLGLTAEQVVGRRWDDPVLRVTDLEGRPIPAEERAFRRVLATGQPVLGYEYLVYHVSGRPVRVLLNGVPVWGRNGLAGVAFTMTDTAERMAADDALRKSEAMLRAFVDQSRYGFFISSVDGEVLLYNHAMETLTGFSAEEVKAKGWLEAAFPDPAERARAAEQARKQFTGEEPYIEELFTRKDGSKVWVSSAVSPVRLQGRDYISGILIDITDRIEAEEKVRFQASLLDHVRNAVIASDATRRIVYVNESAERLFGWKPGEALGRDVLEWGRPTSTEPQYGPPVETLEREGRWEGEATFRRPDGSEVPVLLAISRVTGKGGKPLGVVGVATDLTEIKAAERQLEEKDRAIRQAYVDVFSAVTGGKLVIMTTQEIESVLGDPVTEEGGLTYETVSDSRHRVLAAMQGAPMSTEPDEAIVAFAEAVANAIKHSGGGRYRVFHKEHALQVLVADEGAGIDFKLLPRAALTTGFSTKQTLGMGFTIMLDAADRVLLATRPGCTELVLEFGLRQAAPAGVTGSD